jgi:hypothetical protein
MGPVYCEKIISQVHPTPIVVIYKKKKKNAINNLQKIDTCDDQVKEDEMGRPCSVNWGDEECT